MYIIKSQEYMNFKRWDTYGWNICVIFKRETCSKTMKNHVIVQDCDLQFRTQVQNEFFEDVPKRYHILVLNLDRNYITYHTLFVQDVLHLIFSNHPCQILHWVVETPLIINKSKFLYSDRIYVGDARCRKFHNESTS